MNTLTLLYIVTMVLLAGFGLALARHWYVVMLFVALAVVLYFTGAMLLGKPKPVVITWLDSEAQLIAYTLDEPHAIYLWLALPKMDEPMAYSIPWSRERAERLQHLSQQGEQGRNDGIGVRLGATDDGEPGERMFYPRPVPPLPPKVYN